MRKGHLPALFLLSSLGLASASCGRSLREWRAEDHDEEPSGGGGQVAPMASGSVDDQRALVEAAWNARCFRCHGVIGRGDGPDGQMMKAGDLTAAAFQDKNTDEDIVKVIRAGRDKMPAFPDLPPAVINGLVRRIRSLRAK